MKFEIRVPYGGGDGESLGACEAEALPRVGDTFLVYHPKVCRKEFEPFEGKVDAVVWETNPHLRKPPSSKLWADVVVWLVPSAVEVEIFCDCSEAQRSIDPEIPLECLNCGHPIP